MSVFKRKNSQYYWYDFIFEGRRYQESTAVTNKIAAERIEAIHKGDLARARAGIVKKKP